MILPSFCAGVAQLVEHFLAKEDVASSSLVTRFRPLVPRVLQRGTARNLHLAGKLDRTQRAKASGVDAMGIARLLDSQEPDKMNNQSADTESVSKNNDQKQVKAKQIFLGIDAHLVRNQVARKKDNGGQGEKSEGTSDHRQVHHHKVRRSVLWHPKL